MLEREAAVFDRATVFVCPECPERFGKPEDLGVHLERHREVLPPAPPSPRGKPTSFPCPKSCGRSFRRLTDQEARAHIPICDGSAPIMAPAKEPRTEETSQMAKKKFECEKCPELHFTSPQGLGAHRRHVHPGDSRPRKATPPPSAGSDEEPLIVTEPAATPLSTKQRVLNMLEVEEEQLTKKLGDVKRLIGAVRNCEEAAAE